LPIVYHGLTGWGGAIPASSMNALSPEHETETAELLSLAERLAVELEGLRDENARLVQQLRTDALTGVASRAAWDETLRALARSRGDEPLAIVVVDVDELKMVNDEAGHAAGDALLCHCARLLAESVRSGDLVARIGGDEFGVLLREADELRAADWCARLERGEAKRWSIGWASVPPADSLCEAVAQADRRMYERKLARRMARH
jgi:diguanylate cyclase (GGDEF)-like protein